MAPAVKFTPRPIDGVVVKELDVKKDGRGWLIEILRSDDELFRRFGQVYLTAARPGVVKAWHYHKKQWDHFAVVAGTARIVLFDGRAGSPSRGAVMEIITGEEDPALVVIPPGVYHGFKPEGGAEARVLNVPTELYDRDEPDEYRQPYDDAAIPYDWGPADPASG